MSSEKILSSLPIVGKLLKQRNTLLAERDRLLAENKEIKAQKKKQVDPISKYQDWFHQSGFQVGQHHDQTYVKASELIIEGDSVKNTIFTSKEVLLRGGYDFFPPTKNKFIMFDLGMNIGITSVHWAQSPLIERIFGFEPFIPTYNLALKNISQNNAAQKKVTAFNYGLEDQDRETEIFYNPGYPGSMSSVNDKFENQDGLVKEKIVLKKAADVLQPIMETYPSNCFFLKLDVEGAEMLILKNLDEHQLLEKIDVIIMEFHTGNYKEEIVRLLNKNGFFCFAENERADLGNIKAIKCG